MKDKLMQPKRLKIWGIGIMLGVAMGCSHPSAFDKYQSHSGNALDVKGLIKGIVIDTPLVSGGARLCVLDEYLILSDHHAEDNQVLIFDKKDFSYITGTGHPGEGPDEITNIGELIPDKAHRRLYVTDYGKMQVKGYDLDSLLSDADYLPEYKFDMNKTATPVMFSYVNDTLCYACCVTAEPGKHFQESLVTWNMKTGDLRPLISGHPEVERKRIRYAVSLENDRIAVSYDHHDLLAIYDLEGRLKHYVYGPEWDNATSNAMIYYYGSIVICKDRIIAGYSGERNPDSGNVYVTKLLVYDLEGNYIKTLNARCRICEFCYDPEYNRIIMALDDEMQFAYLDLEGLLE